MPYQHHQNANGASVAQWSERSASFTALKLTMLLKRSAQCYFSMLLKRSAPLM